MEDFKKDVNTHIVEYPKTSLSTMDRSSKQRINQDIVALNIILDQMDLIDINRTFHPKEAKYTFFSNTHGTISKTDHMVGHKTSINKYEKIKIISSMCSNHNSMKLETNLKEKTQKTFKFMETE